MKGGQASERFPLYPARLAALTSLRPGAYEVQALTLRIRLMVASQLPLQDHNAMLHSFSAREESLRFGRDHYRPYARETSTLLYELFKMYSEESIMPDKLQDFVRESIGKLLSTLPPEELRKRLPVEERLKGLPAEERLKGLSTEEVLHGLSPETLEV